MTSHEETAGRSFLTCFSQSAALKPSSLSLLPFSRTLFLSHLPSCFHSRRFLLARCLLFPSLSGRGNSAERLPFSRLPSCSLLTTSDLFRSPSSLGCSSVSRTSHLRDFSLVRFGDPTVYIFRLVPTHARNLPTDQQQHAPCRHCSRRDQIQVPSVPLTSVVYDIAIGRIRESMFLVGRTRSFVYR